LKDDGGNWDQRPHRDRVFTVDQTALNSWSRIVGEKPTTPVGHTRMVYALNRSTSAALQRFTDAPRIADLGLEMSSGWHETGDRTRGVFAVAWGEPADWEQVILQGPHLFVSTPVYKTPNRTNRSNRDWVETDFEALRASAVPVTAYKPALPKAAFHGRYTRWGTDAHPRYASDYYRIAWRDMAKNANSRTLMSAIIPPGATHVHTVNSLRIASGDARALLATAAVMSSLLADLLVRTIPKGNIPLSTIERLPQADRRLWPALALRALRLNAITSAYAGLWSESFGADFLSDSWTGISGGSCSNALGDVTSVWGADSPLRVAAQRRQAQVEIDALVALSLGVSADELCAIYRTQFPVLQSYDRAIGTTKYIYDARGRLVPTAVQSLWRSRGERLSELERTVEHPQSGVSYTYELPFETYDREADMRQAYAEFERRLAVRS
jgi:hypothetical protein